MLPDGFDHSWVLFMEPGVQGLRELCLAEDPSVTWENPPGTEWLLVATRDTKEAVAVSAVVVSPPTARMKSDYVHPVYRGLNLQFSMILIRAAKAKSLGAKIANAFAMDYAQANYERAGFRRVTFNQKSRIWFLQRGL